MPGTSGRPSRSGRAPASSSSVRAAKEGKQVLSKSATAHQQQIQPRFDEFDAPAAKPHDGAPAWKQEVNQRLAAHRNRKPEQQETDARANHAARPATGRAAEAAARVAARYAKAPSYQQVLAGAGAAVRAAGAAAEAARSAHEAAQAVLAGLESELGSQTVGWQGKPAEASQPSKGTAAPRWQDEPPATAAVEQESARLTPWSGAPSRWEDAVSVVESAPEPEADVWAEMRVEPNPELGFRREEQHYYRRGNDPVESELFPEEHFDEYQAADPFSHATVEPIQHLPANLIEFPRELVATRKARPRRAEGPLYDPEHEDPQLSIFDAEPQITAPVIATAAETVAPPEWASIELNHPHGTHDEFVPPEAMHPGYIYTRTPEPGPAYETSMSAVAVEELPLQRQKTAREANSAASERRIRNAVAPAPEFELMVAPGSDRLLALIVDGGLVTLAFLAAAMVVISATAHPPAGKFALIASICGWLVFAQVYQLLFLSYAEEGTPGMRYARIALCTFDDDNPTPAQMRKRIPAMLASMLPAGLGLLWALWDKNHLGWHDRMTKTYQRKY